MERPWTLDQQPEAKATIHPLTFEDLFADEHERLYRSLYLVVGNSHEAEELMQDAFVRVLEPDFERADRIGEFWGYPQSRTFAQLLTDCEEDRALRGRARRDAEGGRSGTLRAHREARRTASRWSSSGYSRRPLLR